MTRDEAMNLFGEAFAAYAAKSNPSDYSNAGTEVQRYKDGREAAATVIQQAFSERDGEIERLREALVIYRNRNNWEWPSCLFKYKNKLGWEIAENVLREEK